MCKLHAAMVVSLVNWPADTQARASQIFQHLEQSERNEKDIIQSVVQATRFFPTGVNTL